MGYQIFKLFGTVGVNGLEFVSKGLKTLDTQFKQADRALVKFGRQSVKIGSSLTKNITTPIVAAGAGMLYAAQKTADYSENLIKLESVTGLSKTTLQEFQHVATVAGVSFEGLTGTIQQFSRKLPQLAKDGGMAYDAIKKLGVNIYDAQGNIRDMNDLFPEFIKKLQDVKNPTERVSIAQQIFGKTVSELAPILAMSNGELNIMRQEAHKLGLVMSDEAINAADEYGDQVDKLKEQFAAFWRNLSGQFIPILQDVLIPLIQTKLIPAFTAMAEGIKNAALWFKNLDPQTQKIILGLTGFVAAAGPMILIVGKLILGFKGIITTIVLMKTAFTGLTIAMATNPFMAVIAGAGLLAGALFAAKMAMIELNELTNKQDRISGLASGIEGLNKQYLRLVLDGKNAVERQKEMSAATADLTQLAEELGFTFDDNNGSMFQQLQALGGVLTKTRNLTTATKEFNAVKKAASVDGGGWGGGDATKKELDARLKMRLDYGYKIAEMDMNDVERLQYERDQAIIEAKKIGASTLEIEMFYRKKIRTVIAQEQSQIEIDQAEALQEKESIETDYAKKAIQQQIDLSDNEEEKINLSIALLETEKAEAIKIAKEKGADITLVEKYFAGEIDKVRKENAEKEKSYLGGTVSQWLGAFSQIGSGISEIFSMATDSKMIQVDNWEAQERASIERSVGSEKTKQKKFDALEKEAAEKRTKLKREEAKRSKKASIFDALVGGASAVIGALGAKPWSVLNFVLAGIVGGLAATKAAFIAAQPIPFADGGLIKGGRGGVTGLVGETKQDELIMPMETGLQRFVAGVKESLGGMLGQSSGFAFAGAGGGQIAPQQTHWHIGTLVADDRGIKELERRQLQFRVSESQRKGQ